MRYSALHGKQSIWAAALGDCLSHRFVNVIECRNKSERLGTNGSSGDNSPTMRVRNVLTRRTWSGGRHLAVSITKTNVDLMKNIPAKIKGGARALDGHPPGSAHDYGTFSL